VFVVIVAAIVVNDKTLRAIIPPILHRDIHGTRLGFNGSKRGKTLLILAIDAKTMTIEGNVLDVLEHFLDSLSTPHFPLLSLGWFGGGDVGS